MVFSVELFEKRFQHAVDEMAEDGGEVYVVETEYGGYPGSRFQEIDRKLFCSKQEVKDHLLKVKVNSTSRWDEVIEHWFGTDLKVGAEPELLYEKVRKLIGREKREIYEMAFVKRIR